MSIMYESLNKNEHWAWGSGEKGVKGNLMWLAAAGEAEIPGD